MSTDLPKRWLRRAVSCRSRHRLCRDAPHLARADLLSACGNIDIDSSAQCSLVTQTDCTTTCAPQQCEQACRQPSSNSSATASAPRQPTQVCTTSCTADCATSCAGSWPTDVRLHHRLHDAVPVRVLDVVLGQRHGVRGRGSASASASVDCQASCSSCCDDKCNTQCVAVSHDSGLQYEVQRGLQRLVHGDRQRDVSGPVPGEQLRPVSQRSLQPVHLTQCQSSTGAIVCNGSYVEADDVQQCIDDALNGVLSVQINATGSCSMTSSSGQVTEQGVDELLGRARRDREGRPLGHGRHGGARARRDAPAAPLQALSRPAAPSW